MAADRRDAETQGAGEDGNGEADGSARGPAGRRWTSHAEPPAAPGRDHRAMIRMIESVTIPTAAIIVAGHEGEEAPSTALDVRAPPPRRRRRGRTARAPRLGPRRGASISIVTMPRSSTSAQRSNGARASRARRRTRSPGSRAARSGRCSEPVEPVEEGEHLLDEVAGTTSRVDHEPGLLRPR